MLGRGVIWRRLIIRVGGRCPAIMHCSQARHLSADSRLWPRWEIGNRRLSSGVFGTRSRSGSLRRAFHSDFVTARGILDKVSRRGREHLTDAFEDRRPWFLIPGTEEHLAHSIQARSLGPHGGLRFEKIANTSVGRRDIGSTFLRKDMLEIRHVWRGREWLRGRAEIRLKWNRFVRGRFVVFKYLILLSFVFVVFL